MAVDKEGKAKVNGARAFRLAPSILDRLKREAARRDVTQTALITSLVEQIGSDNNQADADLRVAKAAARACIAALDLLREADPAQDQIVAAASKLEDFIQALPGGSGS